MKNKKRVPHTKKGSKKKSNVLFYIIFLVGMIILLYPHLSNFYYRFESESVTHEFDREKEALQDEEIQARMDLAHAFNESLHNVVAEDPYSKTRHDAGRAEYARMLELHERMGYIEIPKIEVNLPIYAGTSEEVLQKGVGHLEGTSLPVGRKNTHAVLTAHTGLPKAKLFTDLVQLEIGDTFYIHNVAEILAYEVDQILVVEPHDFSQLMVVQNEDYVTLLTCTPYMVNTHRLLVRGHRIPYTAETYQQESEQAEKRIFIRYMIYAAGMLVAVGIIFLFTKRRKKNQKKCEEREHGNETE